MMMNQLFLYSLLKDTGLDLDFVLDAYRDHFSPDQLTEYDEVLGKAATLISPARGRVASQQVRPLLSSLQGITTGDLQYPFEPLTIKKLFPSVGGKGSYQEILDEFKQAVVHIQQAGLSLEQMTTKLFALLRQYTWCISAGINPPSLSKFEWIKSRAAIAVCLKQAKGETYPFLMVCADISGIQSFIYDIHSNKAAMSMKGRSFYLHLLLDAIIRRLLDSCDATVANVIYASGGKAYLLLPNQPDIQAKLDQLEQKIVSEVFEEHQNSLYVAIDAIAFRIESDFSLFSEETTAQGEDIDNMSTLWGAVSDKAARKKSRRFMRLFENGDAFERIFEGIDLEEDFNGAGMVPCAVSGRPVEEDKANRINDVWSEFGEEGVYVHPKIKEQVNIGRDLRESTALTVEPVRGDRGYWIEPLNLKLLYHLAERNNASALIAINPDKALHRYAISQGPGESQIDFHDFFFYGGNQQAETYDEKKQKNRWKEYDELAQGPEGSGFNKLGVLRMDVDNLGNLFVKEMSNKGAEYSTFAAYSHLSSMLDWFFSGYINTLRNSEKYRDYLNVLYAGGDDLFAIGRWKEVLDFAVEVRQTFREFVGDQEESDSYTLSAGLVFVGGKFPISKAARMAGEALDLAKDHYEQEEREEREQSPDKNAIHLLGTTVSWKKEMDFVLALSEVLQSLLDEQVISKGFIYKLFQFQSIKDAGRRDWWWQSAYFLERYRKRAKTVDEASLFLAMSRALTTHVFDGDSLSQNSSRHFQFDKINFHTQHDRMLDLICLAAKLADYSTR